MQSLAAEHLCICVVQWSPDLCASSLHIGLTVSANCTQLLLYIYKLGIHLFFSTKPANKLTLYGIFDLFVFLEPLQYIKIITYNHAKHSQLDDWLWEQSWSISSRIKSSRIKSSRNKWSRYNITKLTFVWCFWFVRLSHVVVLGVVPRSYRVVFSIPPSPDWSDLPDKPIVSQYRTVETALLSAVRVISSPLPHTIEHKILTYKIYICIYVWNTRICNIWT